MFYKPESPGHICKCCSHEITFYDYIQSLSSYFPHEETFTQAEWLSNILSVCRTRQNSLLGKIKKMVEWVLSLFTYLFCLTRRWKALFLYLLTLKTLFFFWQCRWARSSQDNAVHLISFFTGHLLFSFCPEWVWQLNLVLGFLGLSL